MNTKQYRKRRNGLFIIVFLLSFLLPLAGYLNTPTGYKYMGLPSPLDANTYGSFYQQAKEGMILFTNNYTSEDVPYVMFRPLYLLMGWIGLVLGLSYPLTYHLFRALFIILFFHALIKLVEYVFQDRNHRLAAITLVIISSGAGYILSVLQSFGMDYIRSTDLRLSPSITFMALQSDPHNIASISLMALSAYWLIKGWKEQNTRLLLYASLTVTVLGFIHLFDVITLILALMLAMAASIYYDRKRSWALIRKSWYCAIPPALPVAYTLWLYTSVPEFVSWNSQNILPSPRLYQFIIGYAPLLFLMAVGLLSKYRARMKQDFAYLLLLSWISASFILLYSPFNIQRRFVEGLHIPLAIIATIGLMGPVYDNAVDMIKKVKIGNSTGKAIGLIMIIVILTVPSNVVWFKRTIPDGTETRGFEPYLVPLYLEESEIEALEWIEVNAIPGSTVFASYTLSNYLPRFSNVRVFSGHWAQTINYEDKKHKAARFFGNPEINSELLNGFDYLILEGGTNLTETVEVFRNQRFVIYKVSDNE